MKHVAAIVAAFAVLFGAAAFAVQTLEDRQTFVPGPDAIAEAFTREVLTKRYDRANSYLANEVPREELEQLQARLGEVQNVETETIEQHLTRAVAEVKLKSKSFELPLVWQRGEWRVAALP
jgi:cell shape-determining protein MreC